MHALNPVLHPVLPPLCDSGAALRVSLIRSNQFAGTEIRGTAAENRIKTPSAHVQQG